MPAGPTIVAKFLADTSQMTGEVDKATSTAGSKLDGFAKNAALALGGAFVVDKVVDFGKASVEAASADAEAQAQLSAALKNTTGATDAQVAAAETYIDNLSKQAAIADDDLRPAMATLARGFGDTEDAQKALALATDVSAGTGKDLSTVTEAMMKAAQGQTGALKRLGIETENADGSAKSLDQIMSDMSKTFEGQASVAAESTAGQMRSAEIAMGEMQETIGTALLPVVAKLATMFTDTLLPAIESVFGWIMDNKGVVIAALIGIGAVVVPMFVAWAISAATAAAATLAAAAPLIAIGAVVAGVAYLIIHNWDTIAKVTKKTWDTILGALKFVWNWVKSNWPLLLAIIAGPIGLAALAVYRHFDTIKNAASSVWRWVVDKWNAIGSAISGVVSRIGGYASTIAGYFTSVRDAASATYNWVRDKFNSIADAISGVVGQISGAISRIVSAIKSPINALIGGWNRISFRVPTITLPKIDTGIPGVPTFGGGSWGGQSWNFPHITPLAAGGVLTGPTLFLGGEAGTEIVTPEALMRRIISEESGGASYTLNIYPRTADTADLAYGFRRLELLAGI